MKRAVIIHGWGQRPDQEWLPWLSENLQKEGWTTDLPTMPNTNFPKLNQWMKVLKSLKPDKNTILIGHSLANALILKYLELKEIKLKGVFLVAAWDYLLSDLKKEHRTFFKTGFDYGVIEKKNIPITIIQSTNDPYLDFNKAKILAEKINAKFVPVKNASHFRERDGYKQFPLLLDLITSILLKKKFRKKY